MMRYMVLNMLVLLVLLATAWLLVHHHLVAKRYGYTLITLLALTALFDSLIIGLGIVAYDASHISGVYVGKAPIEDFAYAIAAALFVPALWEYYDEK